MVVGSVWEVGSIPFSSASSGGVGKGSSENRLGRRPVTRSLRKGNTILRYSARLSTTLETVIELCTEHYLFVFFYDYSQTLRVANLLHSSFRNYCATCLHQFRAKLYHLSPFCFCMVSLVHVHVNFLTCANLLRLLLLYWFCWLSSIMLKCVVTPNV